MTDDDTPSPGTERYWDELSEEHGSIDGGYEDFEEAVEDIKESEGEVPPELGERVETLREDPGTDLDAESRQEAGWFSVYVECPNCHAPLAKVGTQAKGDRIETQDGAELDRSRTHLVGVCPDCGEFKSAVQLVKLTGPVEDVPWPDDPAWTWWFEGAGDE